ncbi:MAG: RdgB/HAM1 family non-canonical purine NTP pyrophosphatase [Clostridiaceae bacterium]|jgi:XTP/dITP diphosphohydrolase|nr:RdgB/HAM1 family non-canonical purine NTP pyrophosphatase [Clostridiaceae bacterium]
MNVLHDKLVIASNNKHKLREIREILGTRFPHIFSLAEIGIDVEIAETGATFLENARIKAKTIVGMTGLPALADDSGLEVCALNGAPGVYSARYAGEPCDHDKNNEKLLKALEGVNDRRAAFVSVIMVCFPDGSEVYTEARAEGEILTAPRGTGGFGYDPVFLSKDLDITFAEATSAQKNSVGHRGRAVNNLLKLLEI